MTNDSRSEQPKESRYEKLRRERKFTIVSVDMDIVGRMFLTKGLQYRFEGLPEDAIFVYADRDIQTQSFNFTYLHESFAWVPEGARPAVKYLSVITVPVEPTNKGKTSE